ncbi:MAG: UDP-N-acetylmuramoyl-L-alanine--D-glutamate ligase, partial [Thiohalophilus sp.]
LAAIKGVPGKKLVLIMGGQGKGQDFNLLHDAVKQRARAAILIGEDASLLEQALTDTVQILRAGTMQEAVDMAAQQAQAGDTVLLSPACASFDMFRGFEHRGQTFSDCVRSLSA